MAVFHSLLPQAGLRKGRCTAAGPPPAYHLLVKGLGMRGVEYEYFVRYAQTLTPSPSPACGRGELAADKEE
jgi:hypothetical protein